MRTPAVFILGAAGTGKTEITAASAAHLLAKGEISKIIITRPNVTAGKDMGYLPGKLEDKLIPFLAPLL